MFADVLNQRLKIVWSTGTTLISAALLCNAAGCSDPDKSESDASTVETDVSRDRDSGQADALGEADTASKVDTDTGFDTGVPAIQWPEQDMRGAPPLGIDSTMPEAGEDAFSVLVANIGNIDVPRCLNVAYNLCWIEQEGIIAARIAELDPDVILLQEVLAKEQCDAVENPREDHVCHPSYAPQAEDQVRRLVGDGYTIACDARHGWECIAVKVDVGTIEGCPAATLCKDGARVAPAVEGCSPGFTTSAVTATIGARRLDIVNTHPPSSIDGVTAGQTCRKAYLEHLFSEEATLIEEEVALIAGDFNKDPYRDSPEALDVAYWNQFVGFHHGDAERPFAYHSGIVEHDPPYWTSVLSRKTLDHAVSRGLVGRCITLGAKEGHAPLDLFHGQLIEQLDHLALWCRLGFE